jgi:hypothetical protein
MSPRRSTSGDQDGWAEEGLALRRRRRHFIGSDHPHRGAHQRTTSAAEEDAGEMTVCTVTYVHLVRGRRVVRQLMLMPGRFRDVHDLRLPVAIVQFGDQGLHGRGENAHGAKEGERQAYAGPHALNIDRAWPRVKSSGRPGLKRHLRSTPWSSPSPRSTSWMRPGRPSPSSGSGQRNDARRGGHRVHREPRWGCSTYRLNASASTRPSRRSVG